MTEKQIESAIQVLKAGGIIVYPTDTLYGLGADIFNESAVNKIYKLKGRSQKPISIAVRKESIENYAEVSNLARSYIDRFLPGPLTLVLPKKDIIPAWITTNSYIGIRVPDNEIISELTKFGAITTTSANLSGTPPPRNVSELAQKIKDGIDFIIDAGETKYKRASTVVKINEEVKILRKGVLDIWTKKY